MKIVHFESGLGNQMLNYAEYLAIKENYRDVFIETLIYDTLPAGKGICQWNGYELSRVFGLDLPNIKDIFSTEQYKFLCDNLQKSEYWENNWKYADPIVNGLNTIGFDVENLCLHGTVGDKAAYSKFGKVAKKIFFNTKFGNYFYRKLAKIFERRLIRSNIENQYIVCEKDFYCGQSLKFMYKGEDIERINDKLRKSFEFQNIDQKNTNYAAYLAGINSVSVHARRGDFLQRNNYCYKYGYFKRATGYIKNNVADPVFIFFCDTDSIDWVKNNYRLFGLNLNDHIEYVDWNVSQDSYKDLYLMSNCKHNIITQSSFGWWGSWLNNNEEKITISPDCRINTTVWV